MNVNGTTISGEAGTTSLNVTDSFTGLTTSIRVRDGATQQRRRAGTAATKRSPSAPVTSTVTAITTHLSLREADITALTRCCPSTGNGWARPRTRARHLVAEPPPIWAAAQRS